MDQVLLVKVQVQVIMLVEDLIQFFQQLPQQEVEVLLLGIFQEQPLVCQEDLAAEVVLDLLVVQEDLETLLQLVHLKEIMEELQMVVELNMVVAEVVEL